MAKEYSWGKFKWNRLGYAEAMDGNAALQGMLRGKAEGIAARVPFKGSLSETVYQLIDGPTRRGGRRRRSGRRSGGRVRWNATGPVRSRGRGRRSDEVV